MFGESSTLGILAHETGHRWLARLHVSRRRPRDLGSAAGPAARALELLHGLRRIGDGRQRDRGPGRRHVPHRIGRPRNTAASICTRWAWPPRPRCRAGSSSTRRSPIATARMRPIVGITINGTRRDVLIQDVIDALGPRVPAAADSPRVHRQAFVFVRRASAVLDPQDLDAPRPHPRAVRPVLQPRHREPHDGAHDAHAVSQSAVDSRQLRVCSRQSGSSVNSRQSGRTVDSSGLEDSTTELVNC